MATVTINMLQRRLREYVRLAESGEIVQIVSDGVTVAELRPSRDRTSQPGLEEASSPYYPAAQVHEHLAMEEQPDGWEERGIREGWLRPPTIDDGKPPPRIPVKGLTLEQLMADLERDREDR